jgi:hypothetical protein
VWYLALDFSLDSVRFSQRCFRVNQKVFFIESITIKAIFTLSFITRAAKNKRRTKADGRKREKYPTMSSDRTFIYIITHLIPKQQL